jgi:NHL repeat
MLMRTIGTRRGLLATAACAMAMAIGVVAAGPASAAGPPVIATVTFTAPPGTSLDNPQGITVNNGIITVSNTQDNVVATISGATTATIAGSYEATGESGDGGTAVAATLDSPAGLATDLSGDIYLADTADNVVREITTKGIIRLVAGNGREGYRGDRGPATRAELDNPQDVAVNTAGDVFIADTVNNVIREVTPRGEISTFAGNGRAGYRGDGGPADQAELTSPTGVAVDSLGNLYIADAGNNVVRRVSANGIISTVAGNVAADQAKGGLGGFSGDGGPATSAQLNSPEGVAVDRSGDLFIADTFNNAVREVTPNGLISTLVNSAGTAGRAGDGGPAASAELNTPFAVAVDNSTGNVLIADTSNNRVRIVTGLPVPTTVAGGPVAPTPPHNPPHGPPSHH